MICPPKAAHDLASKWGKMADLRIIRNAGHALSEPGISAELVRIMDDLARI
jgi:proline iminopeptidase